MAPITVIQMMFAGIPVLLLLLISVFLKDKKRNTLASLAVFIAFVEIIFFAVSPFMLDFTIKGKQSVINQYLARKYPNESWKIERFDKENPSANPYVQVVTFTNEPGYTYRYIIENGKVYQRGWGGPAPKSGEYGKHYEGKKTTH
ncbi:hypothetical protein [Aneurinibacillus tyrosinisolvens]|uniref:hypothetical protein n=1 Tax=Aneurinibacillus tyrosinisolvens TaxID=1443435 RepID=UPI00063F253F|nr:hypothetical protein [Aneurinibacillus tyrosinisolvens]